VNFFVEAITFILEPANWAGENGIGARLAQHLSLTALSLLAAAIIAVPLGLFIGHTGRGRAVVIGITGAARALPTFGVLSAFVLVGLGLGYGLSPVPIIAVLVLLAIPPLLAGAYAGVEAVDRSTVDAARALGMTEGQVLGRVELPLAMPLLLGGLRSAVLQVVATATIAAYFAGGALGRYLIEGLRTQDYPRALIGAVLVATLALVLDAALAVIQRLVGPRGVSRGATRFTGSTAKWSPRPLDATRTP
jgi:osmoprotectant transport system permease protein